MSKYYISRDNIEEAIKYFKHTDFNSDDILFLFLLTKKMGISLRNEIMLTELSTDERDKVLHDLWLLGGLQDRTEIGEKRTVAFPNTFNSEGEVSFYQKSSNFKQLASRSKDTIEKKNAHNQLYDLNNKRFKLNRNYQENLENNYLYGKKISLKHFASWIFRFTEFEIPENEVENFDNIKFTNVVRKSIMKLFKINSHDFVWLFEDDILRQSFKFSRNGMSGEELRGYFVFDEEPMVEKRSKDESKDIINHLIIPEDETKIFLELKGDNPSYEQILEILQQKKQIVLTGVPGVGKSRFINELCESSFFNETKIIQFHANFSYEDFIGGETIENNEVTTEKGVFLEFIEKAITNPDANYLFIIDELNRGNVAQILGESILALDRGNKVTLAKEIEGHKEFEIPANLFIAATMNTSDRNIAFLDLAIRRRFAFIELSPNYELLSTTVAYKNFDLGSVLKKINNNIYKTLGKVEYLLGHSYFITDFLKEDDKGKLRWENESFHLQFNFVLLPTLKEYAFSNQNALYSIIGEDLSEGILDKEEFELAFELYFKDCQDDMNDI